jgi:hydrogenase small subunit
MQRQKEAGKILQISRFLPNSAIADFQAPVESSRLRRPKSVEGKYPLEYGRFTECTLPMTDYPQRSACLVERRLEGDTVVTDAATRAAPQAPIGELDVLWITAGLGCDGDTIAMTAATQPSIEDIVLGALPWIPQVVVHNPFLAPENGEEFMAFFHRAAEGDSEKPFILVIEGSIPNEHNKEEGYWASFGSDAVTGEPITTCEWIDRLAPRAWAVLAVGTCATYGGIHAMEGNPTGCMGLPDYLGWKWRSRADIPIVCVPGCPVQPDNFMETLLYLLYMASGRAPMIPLDDALRPTWLFGNTVHEGCDRGGFYEQAQFADEYGSPLCIVKLGCWGPVVQCNVGKRGWMSGIGGCPNVGGICIGCTMPGFPDKFMPFMNQPPGSLLSSSAVQTYGRAIHALRRFTQASMNKEPSWRKRTQ